MFLEGHSMGNYIKLLDYIPYFENEDVEFCKWDSGYPNYDDKLEEFIKSIYDSDLLKGDYLEYLNEKVKDKNISASIPSADWELLKSSLTYFVRQERFCDGTWAMAAKDQVFLRILYRLRELEEQ